MASNGHLFKISPEGVASFWDLTLGRHACLLCWEPPDALAETCTVKSARGLYCTREPKHDGPHAACGSKRDDHPLEIWEGASNGSDPEDDR